MAERTARRIVRAVAAVLLAQFASETAVADETTGTVDVQATVVPMCFIGSGAINFGNIPGLKQGESGHIDTSGEEQADTAGHSIWYACSKGTTASAYLSGTNDWFDGDSMGFRMSGADGSFLPYRVYSDASRTNILRPDSFEAFGIWGDGTEHTLDLYGSIADSDVAQVGSGSYSDTITVTVMYNLGG